MELYKQYKPPRRKLVVLVPIQMLLAVIFGCCIPIFTVIVVSIPLTVLCGVLSVACIVWLILSWRKCNREELALSKAEYCYLWEKEFPRGEEFEMVDEEYGVVYKIKENGLQIVYPKEEGEEQVFDEVEENVRFIPWSNARCALATSNAFFFARIAVAVVEVNGEGYSPPFILPLSKALVCAMKSFEVEEKMDGNWVYLFYNPDDALKQIYKKGYIREMRDRKTGELIPLAE